MLERALAVEMICAVEDEFPVAAAVIGVMVGSNDVSDRLRGDAFHVGNDGVVILLIFVVDQEHAIVRDQHGDIAAVAFDFEEAVLLLLLIVSLGGCVCVQANQPRNKKGSHHGGRARGNVRLMTGDYNRFGRAEAGQRGLIESRAQFASVVDCEVSDQTGARCALHV